MKSLFIALLLIAMAEAHCQSPTEKTQIMCLVGPSVYLNTAIDGVGGGSSGAEWNAGPTLGLGIQIVRSKSVILVIDGAYSAYTFKPPPGTTAVGNVRARVYDISVNAKTGGNVYVQGGLGLAYSVRDDGNYAESGGIAGSFSGAEGPSYILRISLGGQFPITEKLSMFVQGDFRFRAYSTLAVETGVLFPIW